MLASLPPLTKVLMELYNGDSSYNSTMSLVGSVSSRYNTTWARD